jgi:hypothetical protein
MECKLKRRWMDEQRITLSPPLFQMPAKRVQLFSKSIGDNKNSTNFIEAFRVAVTDEADSICNVHVDGKNDPRYSTVFVFSKLLFLDGQRVRVSIICYSRKSIGDYFVKAKQYRPAIDWVFRGYEKMSSPPISPEWIKRLEFTKVPPPGHAVPWSLPTPHTDPVIHHSLMAASIEANRVHFDLSLIEVHSLFVAMAYIPGSPSFVAQAALRHRESLVEPRRGSIFGYDVLARALLLWHKMGTGNDRPERYHMYSSMPLPSEEAFQLAVERSCRLSLVLFRNWPHAMKSTTTALKIYKRTQTLLSEPIKNFGSLGSNHVLGAMAIVGLVPIWMYDFCTLPVEGKPFGYIHRTFGVAKKDCESFFKTICIAFERHYGISSCRLVENIICKVFQRSGRKDDSAVTFRDVVLLGQPVYQVDRGSLRVITASGTVVKSSALMETISFRGKIVTMTDFAAGYLLEPIGGNGNTTIPSKSLLFPIPKGI